MTQPIIPPINGDQVVVHRGDQLVTLDDRLVALDRKMKRLTRLVYVLVAIAIASLLFSPEVLVPFLLKLVGL